jgi:hypothetical protein
MIRTLPTTLLSLCLFLPFQAAPTFAQQTSPGTAQQPQPAPAPSPKPAPAAQPETPLNSSDAQFSIQLFYWQPFDQPDLRGGAANVGPYPGNLSYPGKPKRAPGAVISLPAGRNNTLRVSYFRIQGEGNTTAPANLTLFNTDFSPGDYLVTSYTLQNVKVSYDFLSYPYPANPARFRLKTLWEVQYTTIQNSIDAPLKPVLTDASGNPISNTATGTRWMIYPSLGLAIEKALTAHFRVEAKASGFAVPHHATIYDAEASAVFRTGRYEVAVGAKAFHFKTSTQNSQYLAATFPGVFVAFRYYPKWLW